MQAVYMYTYISYIGSYNNPSIQFLQLFYFISHFSCTLSPSLTLFIFSIYLFFSFTPLLIARLRMNEYEFDLLVWFEMGEQIPPPTLLYKLDIQVSGETAQKVLYLYKAKWNINEGSSSGGGSGDGGSNGQQQQ